MAYHMIGIYELIWASIRRGYGIPYGETAMQSDFVGSTSGCRASLCIIVAAIGYCILEHRSNPEREPGDTVYHDGDEKYQAELTVIDVIECYRELGYLV